jgi:membrane glycosyltransferase
VQCLEIQSQQQTHKRFKEILRDVKNEVEQGATFADALRRHTGSTALGIVWGLAAWWFMPDFFWWLSPVLAGLALSIPLSMISSRPEFGRAARVLRLFLIPEEIDPPQVLARLPRFRAELKPDRPVGSGFDRLLFDAKAREVHFDLLPEPEEDDPLHRHQLAGLRLKARLRGLDALTRKEQMEIMLDRATLEAVAHEFGEGALSSFSDSPPAVTALRPSR